MQVQHPKISVCLPVFNGERYLPELVDSVLAQSFRDFEFLIADNASTDRTSEICAAYAERDPRITYCRNERNIGANGNSNLLFRMARGDFVVLFGHDDVVRPEFLEKCLAQLEQDPDLVLCHTLTDFIGPDGERMELGYPDAKDLPDRGDPDVFRLYKHVAEQADPAERFRPFGRDIYFGDHHYGLIRRSALLRTMLLEPYYGSDTVMLAELALMGRFKTIDEVLFLRRIHTESSFYLSSEEQQQYAAPDQKRGAPGRVFLTVAYARAIMRATNLTVGQKARCLSIIAGRLSRAVGNRLGREVKKIVPGPSRRMRASNLEKRL